MNNNKTVGILGGMGPYTTLDFFKEILDNTPAKKDWEHLRLIIDNNVKIPSRTRAILYGEQSPVEGMVQSINNLHSIGADFVVVPCNSAHYFYEEVSNNIDIPWLNMLQIVSEKLKKVRRTRPLILGAYVTVVKKTYDQYLKSPIYLNQGENELIYKLIEEVKLNSKASEKSQKTLLDLIHKYKTKADSVILACTELPLVIKSDQLFGLEVINPTKEYALSTIDFAKRK